MCSQRGSTCNYKAIKEQNLNKEFILKQTFVYVVDR